MMNIQFTSLVGMVHQFPNIAGVCRLSMSPGLTRIDLRPGSRRFYCLVTSSCISAGKWNQQDEKHEDNQEHDCPSGETTETSSIVHGPTPLSRQMLLGYACLTA
jgi:hypothetical protein